MSPTTNATPQETNPSVQQQHALVRGKEKTALFIIDIQKDLALDETTQIPHAERVKYATRAILASARRRIAPSLLPAAQNDTNLDSKKEKNETDIIVFVQHHESPERGPLQKGTTAWELVFEPSEEGLKGGWELLAGKKTRDTFESNPNLADELKTRGIKEIIACGIQSECCVQSTCLGALKAGFEVTLLRGAHSTYDIGEEKAAVEVEREVEALVGDKGGRVLDWEGVVAFWESSSSEEHEGGLSLAGYS